MSDKLVTYLTHDEDDFLKSLQTITYDEISILMSGINGVWIGYAENKGIIVIQRFPSLEELISYYLDWGLIIKRGKLYSELIAANEDQTRFKTDWIKFTDQCLECLERTRNLFDNVLTTPRKRIEPSIT